MEVKMKIDNERKRKQENRGKTDETENIEIDRQALRNKNGS